MKQRHRVYASSIGNNGRSVVIIKNHNVHQYYTRINTGDFVEIVKHDGAWVAKNDVPNTFEKLAYVSVYSFDVGYDIVPIQRKPRPSVRDNS